MGLIWFVSCTGFIDVFVGVCGSFWFWFIVVPGLIAWVVVFAFGVSLLIYRMFDLVWLIWVVYCWCLRL